MSIETANDIKTDTLIVKGSLWAAIWHMTWPILINMCAFAIASFVDTWVAGRLGVDAQAAMGIGWQVRDLMMLLTIAMAVGANAIISRYYGARDIKNTVEAGRQALIFAALFGTTSACIGLLIARHLLHFLGTTPCVEEQGWQFLSFAVTGTLPSTLLWISQSIFRATGAPRIAMATAAITVVLIVLLDFVFCLSPLHMGIAGIGLSWFIASWIGFALNIYNLQNSEMAGCLRIMDSFHWGNSLLWCIRFMKIGLPGCMQVVALLAGNFGLLAILSHTTCPTVSQAAWTVGWRIEEVAVILPMSALSMAIATIVGQNLGALNPQRAEQAGWNMACAGVIINILVAAFLWCLAPDVAKFMSNGATVTSSTIDYLHIVIWTEPFLATWSILSGAMQGAGYTRVPMMITVLCLGVLRLATTWYLSNVSGHGANGTWIAMALASVLAGTLMALAFKWGRWKHHAV